MPKIFLSLLLLFVIDRGVSSLNDIKSYNLLIELKPIDACIEIDDALQSEGFVSKNGFDECMVKANGILNNFDSFCDVVEDLLKNLTYTESNLMTSCVCYSLIWYTYIEC